MRYRCEDGELVRIAAGPDSATLEGLPAGPERLLLDAGGVGPLQRVYANARLRLEMGLGPGGTEARLHHLHAARSTRCAGG